MYPLAVAGQLRLLLVTMMSCPIGHSIRSSSRSSHISRCKVSLQGDLAKQTTGRESKYRTLFKVHTEQRTIHNIQSGCYAVHLTVYVRV